MRLNAVDNVTVSLEKKNELLGGSMPAKDVAAIGSGQDEVVAPPGGLFDHGSCVPVSSELLDVFCSEKKT